ncbi:cell wall hydrolase [Heliobacillus mobilis]|uniref:Cell wall hydrolase n=1 Tax=Heliobacterium mobile TaxID=28064 RepID=A0A6I3SLT1_HELMO|nr:N-acetylmuramoyl-L-alanine amidase [Heliobacterium mobile]MTV49417.1 cell wall hydrolase [Heliobacterium mobile]
MRSFVFVFGKQHRIWMSMFVLATLGLIYTGVQDLLEERAVLSMAASTMHEKVIAIDPGHGGEDGGAVGVRGTLEKEINLQIAKKVTERLRRVGAKVVLTRETDQNIYEGEWSQRAELSKRVELAKEAKAQAYVSIHANSFPYAPSVGHQTFYQYSSEEGKRMALHIQHELDTRLGNRDGRQAKAEDYFVMRTTACPAVMVEVGFLSNAAEEALLKTEDYQEKVADGIYVGLVRYMAGEPAPGDKGKTKPEAAPQQNGKVPGMNPAETTEEKADAPQRVE